MLNESECFFWGEEGLSGLTAGSVWLIVQSGKGTLVDETESPDFRSLEVGISGITIIKHFQEKMNLSFALKRLKLALHFFLQSALEMKNLKL